MLCVMHECQPYGHLARNGAPIPDKSVAELVKVRLRIYLDALAQLELNGVFSRLPDGTIYSRRMVRDERIREVRAAAGKQGGNPILVGNKDKQNGADRGNLLNHASNLDLTPSSSSSSSKKRSTGNGAVDKSSTALTWAQHWTRRGKALRMNPRKGESEKQYCDRVIERDKGHT